MIALRSLDVNPIFNSKEEFKIIEAKAVSNIASTWMDLCGRTAEDNVYYTPNYALAILDANIPPGDVIFLTAWEDDDLIGLLPVTRQRFALPILGPCGGAWRTKYTFGCIPLIDSARREAATRLLLDGMSSLGRGEWILPTVNAQGPACEAWIRELDRRGAPWLFMNAFQRASIAPACAYDEYLRLHIAPKRRREIQRNARRLQELGKFAFESHTEGEGLERAVSSFLELEAAGWKGRAGTALACDPASVAFAREAFASRAGRSSCRADMITIDGKPVAIGLTVFDGRTGFTVKCCYDEELRSFSPGIVLELEVIRSLLTDKWAKRLDAATAGSHVVDGLWPDRIEVADLVFSLAPRHARARLTALESMLGARRRLKSAARSLIARARQARVKVGKETPREGARAKPSEQIPTPRQGARP
ncbi:MAG: GNAT family N-acetyltransferase [Salinarimonadaceae bacterium]|nr:MAG: GNAT family N-acetyltransferase [Salinarimonadaceae bacterium]